MPTPTILPRVSESPKICPIAASSSTQPTEFSSPPSIRTLGATKDTMCPLFFQRRSKPTTSLPLQRAHLINNTLPGPGPLGPRRPFKTLTFVSNTTLPPSSTDAVIQSQTFPVSTINLLENSAQSWYDAGYINVRRHYSHGLSFLGNYTFAKNLTNAPDFRSAMDEASIPQNNLALNLEKGPGCDVRQRFALSAVYAIPAYDRAQWMRLITQNWNLSTIYQVQTGMPLTISVFGDTANSGTVLGENPVRANATGQPVFGPRTRTANSWFNPAAFSAPPALTYGSVG